METCQTEAMMAALQRAAKMAPALGILVTAEAMVGALVFLRAGVTVMDIPRVAVQVMAMMEKARGRATAGVAGE